MVNINVLEAKDKITKIFMNVGVNKDEATRTQTYIIQLHTLKSLLKKTVRIRFIDFRNVADYQNRNYFRGEFDFSFRI